MQRGSDLLVVMILATGGAVAAQFSDLGAFRIILGVPFVLILPGYAVTAVLFPPGALDSFGRLLYTLALSVCSVILLGLVLNGLPGGLSTESWALALWLLVVGVCAAAWTRRIKSQSGEVERVHLPRLTLSQWLLWSLAALITTAALWIASRPTSPEGLQGYTQLWIQPLADAEPVTVIIGVESKEFQTVAYELYLETGDMRRHWGPFELETGASIEQRVHLERTDIGLNPVTVKLYRTDAPNEVYRYVEWWPEPP